MAVIDYTSDIQKLYVAYFNRPADYEGLAHWNRVLNGNGGDINFVSSFFAKSNEYADQNVGKTNYQIVNQIYLNLFNRNADAGGLEFWAEKLRTGTFTVDQIVKVIADTASDAGVDKDKTTYANKVAAATAFSAELNTSPEIIGYGGEKALSAAKTWLSTIGDTASLNAAIAPAALQATVAAIVEQGGQAVTLTNGTDVVTGNIFNSGLVYNPAGTDRINALQSEDVLTGASNSTNNTLNATLGNANDNGSRTITPTLKNIQTINLDVTGNTNALDVRFADSLQSLNINRLTAEASNSMTINNIGQVAANLSVKNSANVDGDVNFNYINGVLAAQNASGTAAGGNVGNVAVENVALATLHIGNFAQTEGFETINLTATGTNSIRNLRAVDAETVKITGSGDLTLANNSNASTGEYTVVGTGGITIGNGIGIRTIDATGHTGDLNINVSSALGGHRDPGNSGSRFFTEIKLGSGDDTIWTTSDVAVGSATLFDNIDGGAGTDTLRTFSAGVARGAKITNVEALELRGAGSSAYISSFDAALTSVLMRNEFGPAQTFSLQNTTKALAEGGKIVLRHSVTAGGADVVNVNLADASGASDTVVVTVENDLNTTTTYNYTITAQSQMRADAPTTIPAPTNAQLNANRVENLTINDNDTETNVVTVTRAADHTGTVTLTGGVAAQGYTVNGTLVAKTVDASAQKSNLNLTVGAADQTIKLGSGDDILTFDAVDTFNGLDILSDVGGTDTVRAAFSKDVTGTPDLTGIEKLHIVATANTTLDLAKGQGISELAIMSDAAVNQAGEVFSAAQTGVQTTDIITLRNTKLNQINFFGDADGTATDGADGNTGPDSSAYIQNFNGVTLENNTGDAVAVNISAPLRNGADSAILPSGAVSPGDGIKAYNLGQLTTHGVKDLSIVVSDEFSANGTTVAATDAKTTIANIWDRDLVNLKLTARGSVDVGTVTGNTVNSNMKIFDASAVGGNVNAIVKALGDGAVVTLAGGDDVFNALGSAGNNVVINAGNGKNNIVGTAQSDYITTGSGNDVIDANRGNNTVRSGAGNDIVSALNGSNTVDVGSGWADRVTFNYDTIGQQNLATNVIAGTGTNAIVSFDSDNNGTADTVYGFAVGDGAELSVKFTGTTFDASASTLNGRSAVVANAGGAFATPEASLSNLLVVTNATANLGNVTAGSAADVFLDLRSGVATAADAYDVSTGAGNDAIVIAQDNTAAHTINAGTGADRIVLSQASAVDTLVVLEGDSTAAARDIVSNFEFGVDRIDLSGTPTIGTVANLTTANFNTTGTQTVSVDPNGFVTIVGATAPVSGDAVIAFLAANSTTNGDVFFYRYDSNGDNTVDAADNVLVFQNAGTDVVIELVAPTGIVGAGIVI